MHATNGAGTSLLHNLGVRFDRLHADWLLTHAEAVWQYGLFEEECEKSGLSPRDNFAAWDQLRIDMCVAAAVELEDEALQRVEAVTKEIRGTPARTFAELAVKARALRFDAHLSTQCDLPEKDQDWPEQVMNEFVAELDCLASVERSAQ
jgi:hypothetical protein